MLRRRRLDIREVLRWADAHRESTGKWPTRSSGGVVGVIGETWSGIDAALVQGLRGLPGGSSLVQLFAETRAARNNKQLPPLTKEQVLRWADDHFQRTGAWPTAKSGTIPDSGGDKWVGVDAALEGGGRGFPGGSSLPRLLQEHRGVRNRKALPPLKEEDILVWADAHHRETGRWPTAKSGPIALAPGETWMAVQVGLRAGQRGLPGGSSLAQLLAAKRGVRNHRGLPPLSDQQVLAWADAHHQRTGDWPHVESGVVQEAPGETWRRINKALVRGGRGLQGGRSLAELLRVERNVRNRMALPELRLKDVLAWADAHYRRTNQWPTLLSGPIPEAPEETWCGVNTALQNRSRGLSGPSSLAQLLDLHGKKRNHRALPRLSYKKICLWADAHYERTGRWPNTRSGPVAEAPEEDWKWIDNALRQGDRGLPGGSSLLRLLARKRGVRNIAALPALTEEQVRHWAICHHRRTGAWPDYKAGLIADAPGETWSGVDSALRYGKRGLPGGSSLAKLVRPMQEEGHCSSATTSAGAAR